MNKLTSSEFVEELQNELELGLQQLGVEYEQADALQLIRYVQLLSKWNKVYNLTAIRDEKAMLSHHLLDSIAVLPALQGENIVDVGAGAGLPGIVLAIINKDRHFFELESNKKKARFMQQAIVELGLKNVTVLCQRAEEPCVDARIEAAGKGFDTVISRAFSSLQEMLHVAGHLCKSGGLILAMKGKMPKSELNSLPKGYICDKVDQLIVPGLEAERHLVHIKLNDET